MKAPLNLRSFRGCIVRVPAEWLWGDVETGAYMKLLEAETLKWDVEVIACEHVSSGDGMIRLKTLSACPWLPPKPRGLPFSEMRPEELLDRIESA